MTRTVEDAALMLRALSGHDPADPGSARGEPPDYGTELRRGARGLRLGIPRGFFFDRLHPDVRSAMTVAANAFEGLGIPVQEVSLPRIHHAAAAVFAIISAEAMAFHEAWLRTRGAEYGADVRTRLLAGQFVLATQYLKAQRARRVITAEVDAALARVDALLLPTTPLPAPGIGEQRVTLGDATEDVRGWLTRCTRPFNLTGHPVLSVPCGLTQDGLPVGLSLVGRAFHEAALLRLGQAYEAVSPVAGRIPPLAAWPGVSQLSAQGTRSAMSHEP
jgi:aspartyl-tRNA(Asn)/glutamyl-tRNA(Gln) amidotransferase subunit A